MAVKNSGYFPPAGQQNPSKYPRVGPNYLKYGEQPGWTYSPRDDKYYRDQASREALQKYEEEQGLRTPAPKEPKQPGLGQVILPIAATGAAISAGNYIGQKIPSAFESIGKTAPPQTNVNGQITQPTQVGGTTAVQGSGQIAGTPQGLLGANGAPSTGTTAPANTGAPATPNLVSVKPVVEVGSTTMPDGSPGTLMSDGGKIGQNGQVVNPDGTVAGSVSGQIMAGLQVAGGAAQAYNGYKQYQAGEKLGGAANVAGGAFNAAAGAQALANGGTAGSLGSWVPGVGWVVAGAQIGQQMLNDKGASEDRAAKAQYEAQKASLLFIPGYGWVAYAALAAADALTKGKAGEKIMGFNKKMDDNVINKIDFGIKKSLDKKLFHQSTKGVQQMHSGQLMAQSDDPTWQNYVAGMRAQVNEGPKDPLKPFAGGKYATFEEYKKAGLQADDLTGVYGNLDAFKPDYAEKAGVPDWSKLTYDQQRYMTQKLIEADAYASKKGEVVIPDKEKARRIYEQEAKNNFGAPSAAPQPTGLLAANKPAPLQPGVTPQQAAGAAGGQPYQPINANGALNGAVPTGKLPSSNIDLYNRPNGLLGALPPRSRTSSPGMDKNGRRITY